MTRAWGQQTTNSPASVCPTENLLPKRRYETEKYHIYICRGDRINTLGYFVRIAKTDGHKITLPVTGNSGEIYRAEKAEITHIINPYEVTVNKRGRTIFRERVERAIAGDGNPLATGCPQGSKTFIEAETNDFFLYICGDSSPNSYVAVTRNDNEKVTAWLQNHGNQQPNQYVAVKGDLRYVLNSEVLTISSNGEVIYKERLLRVIAVAK
ncbi:hypothetical protein IJ00_06995 [Calothrix sp. 336/3]|nr:hypothetical protein IJ00_06995 [Calothrix sp. 336/3]